MPGLSIQVSNNPVFFPQLNGGGCEREHFTATKTATQQNCENRVVPFTSKVRVAGCREQSFTLVSGQPIPKAQADPSDSFYATDTGGEFRTVRIASRKI